MEKSKHDLTKTIIDKLTIKEFGVHLSTYVSLFTHPYKSWMKAINIRKSSFDFIILNIIYYGIFLFYIIQEPQKTIQLLFLDLLTTIVPFILFYPSFKICIFLSKKRIKSNRLFRLFLIFKFQSTPILILFLLMTNWFDSENLFIVIENFIVLVLIGYMIVYLLVAKMKLWVKVLSFFINYVIFISVFLIFSIFEISFELKNADDYSTLNTPTTEFRNFFINSSHAERFILDDKYFVLLEVDELNQLINFSPQFVNHQLLGEFYELSKIKSEKKLIEYDSILFSLKKSHISSLNLTKNSNTKAQSTKMRLDSLKKSFTKIVDTDMKVSDSLRLHAKFNSNRQYFQAYFKYLEKYYSTYVNNDSILKILTNKKTHLEPLKINENEIITIYEIDTLYYEPQKSNLIKQKKLIDKRDKSSGFLFNILFYPIL
ncbi:hypothetical protein [Flavobacterium sp. UBA6135]|uniref:hypothetical protein n=1 Tax=Flavobacterium sp. UBA6135 TaxID=1946553 RepID=UPI0025BAE554|nr:hypothetical protein [Flavobacterium sp. UBA6135]